MMATLSRVTGTVAALYSSPEHVYVGHFGRAPGTTAMEAATRLRLVAGRGILGDRYFNRPAGQKGQVTFFAEETWRRLGEELGCADLGPEVFRRNVLTRQLDLLALVGAEFEIQGVRFRGTEHCKPCCWMDQAFAPGAFAALSAWQAGGLRAEVLTDGELFSA
jgi:MOSC domain-containing protein YiiM